MAISFFSPTNAVRGFAQSVGLAVVGLSGVAASSFPLAEDNPYLPGWLQELVVEFRETAANLTGAENRQTALIRQHSKEMEEDLRYHAVLSGLTVAALTFEFCRMTWFLIRFCRRGCPWREAFCGGELPRVSDGPLAVSSVKPAEGHSEGGGVVVSASSSKVRNSSKEDTQYLLAGKTYSVDAAGEGASPSSYDSCRDDSSTVIPMKSVC